MIEKFKAFLKRTPIVTVGASITGLIVAGIYVVNSFAPGTVPSSQIDDIAKSLAGLWIALAAVAPFVTSSASPKIESGTTVRVASKGNTTHTTTV